MEQYTPEELARGLHAILADTSEREHPKIIRGFVAMLRKQGLLKNASQIMEAFERYAQEQKERMYAEVAHAVVFPQLPTTEDAALVGGARLHRGDTVVDNSLRGRMNQLKRKLEIRN